MVTEKSFIDAFEAWLAKRPKDPVLNGLVASVSFEEIKDNKVANAANPNSTVPTSRSLKLSDIVGIVAGVWLE